MCIAERPSSAGHEPFRVHHMRRPILVDMHKGLWEALNQVPGRAGMIEMHVRQGDVPQVVGTHPASPQLVDEVVERSGRAGIHQGRLHRVDQITGDCAFEPLVNQVYALRLPHEALSLPEKWHEKERGARSGAPSESLRVLTERV